MNFPLALALLILPLSTLAETPQQIRAAYASEAAATQPGFSAAAQRGERLFRQQFTVTAKMPSCTSCHTANPLQAGEHVVTGKAIRPLAVAANGERFTDPAKVEKWFGRNCKEVMGRDCSAAEKADLIAFLTGGR